MQHKLLDTVVLDRDIPAHGLCKGDLGAVVELYKPDSLEVEFVMPNGQTRALLTLHAEDVRPLHDTDILAVRPLTPAGTS
jgi:hypothetical protein